MFVAMCRSLQQVFLLLFKSTVNTYWFRDVKYSLCWLCSWKLKYVIYVIEILYRNANFIWFFYKSVNTISSHLCLQKWNYSMDSLRMSPLSDTGDMTARMTKPPKTTINIPREFTNNASDEYRAIMLCVWRNVAFSKKPVVQVATARA